MRLPISLYKDLFRDVFVKSADDFSNVNVIVRDEFSVDYPNLRSEIKDFMNTLPVYTLSDLGLGNSNINATFSTTTSLYLLVNLQSHSNITNSKLFGIVDYNDLNKFTCVVWLKNNYI